MGDRGGVLRGRVLPAVREGPGEAATATTEVNFRATPDRHSSRDVLIPLQPGRLQQASVDEYAKHRRHSIRRAGRRPFPGTGPRPGDRGEHPHCVAFHLRYRAVLQAAVSAI